MAEGESKKITVLSVSPDESLREEEGWHKMKLRWVIDEKVGAKLGTLGFTIFPPGGAHKPHRHPNAEEYVIVMKGRGLHKAGDRTYEAGPGDVIFIPKGQVHSAENLSDTETHELYFIYAGQPSLEKSGYVAIKEEE